MCEDLSRLEKRKMEYEYEMNYWKDIVLDLWRGKKRVEINPGDPLECMGEEGMTQWGPWQLVDEMRISQFNEEWPTPSDWFPDPFNDINCCQKLNEGSISTAWATEEEINFYINKENSQSNPTESLAPPTEYFDDFCYDPTDEFFYNDYFYDNIDTGYADRPPPSICYFVGMFVPNFTEDITFIDAMRNYIQSIINFNDIIYRINVIRNDELEIRRNILRCGKMRKDVKPFSAAGKPYDISDYLTLPEDNPSRSAFEAGRRSILSIGGKYDTIDNQRTLDELSSDVKERVKKGHPRGIVKTSEEAYDFINREVLAADAQEAFHNKNLSYITDFISHLTTEVFSKIKYSKPMLDDNEQRSLIRMPAQDAMKSIESNNILETHRVGRELKDRVNSIRAQRRHCPPIADPTQHTIEYFIRKEDKDKKDKKDKDNKDNKDNK